MFYRTTDTALDRWTNDEGYEFAYSYDYDVSVDCPLDWNPGGIYLDPRSHRNLAFGDESLKHRVELWREDREQLEIDVEEAGTSEEHHDATEALLDHYDNYHGIEAIDHGDYTVYLSRAELIAKWGCSPEDVVTQLNRELETFDQWANGEVYVAGMTSPDGDTEDLGGIYLDPTRDDRTQIEEIMRDFF